jgi:hypothetical protein
MPETVLSGYTATLMGIGFRHLIQADNATVAVAVREL